MNKLPRKNLAVVHGFDRIEFWLDRPELPFNKAKLEGHCAEITIVLKQAKYQAQRKLKITLLQPTSKCIQLLLEGLGRDVMTFITYVEITCDILTMTKKKAIQIRDEFLASAYVKKQRGDVLREKSTWYFGRRATEVQKKSRHLVVTYADKPSKINNARPSKDAPPCFHLEWRVSGADALATVGIGSLADLIGFNHTAFWQRSVTFYQLPKKQKLGCYMAQPNESKITPYGYRKRANKLIEENSIKDKFVMHNAVLACKNLKRKLPRETFQDWISKATKLTKHESN